MLETISNEKLSVPPLQVLSSKMTCLLFGAAAVLTIISCTGSLSAQTSSGEKLYVQKCADCHGARGQGVDEKYRDALFGDWERPRLTRYIAKNMPDDDPGILSSQEAETVAAYVYDAFYSHAAQARLHPPRIEITHLTNRQYAVTLADLLKQLDPHVEAAQSAAPGLSSIIYSSAQRERFDPAKIVYRGVDTSFDFQFSESSEMRTRAGTAKFSVQWRGAIVAEESGDHEFVFQTPNSVRAWINADPLSDEPSFDANVTNPDITEHRVTVRLIGGRSYPLAIDYWTPSDKVGVTTIPKFALRWRPPHGSERTIPSRNLSTVTVAPTFVVKTHFPADDSSQGYERGVSLSKEWDEATTRAAFEVVSHVLKRIDRLAGTAASEPSRAAKLEAFASRFVAGAFRRPLSPEELQRYVAAPMRAAPDPEAGLRRVVLLALKSPRFLYVDLPTAKPDPSRVAARLASTLWDSVPDADLVQATSHQLNAALGVTAQAERMLTDPRARAKVREFFQQWLQIRYVEDLRKDSTLFPDFSADVVDDLRTSLGLLVDDIVWSERSDFRELLRADYLFANDRIAKFYGLPAPGTGDFVRVVAPPGQRSGVLTHPYVLASLSYKATSSPIHRGVFLTRSIIGRALKPPPMAQTFDEASFQLGMTMREKVAKLTRSENCQGCHAVINPLGFSLEWYDAAGRFRTAENGRPIDAVSDYVGDENENVRLGSARDVAEFAITSERANRAFIEQLFNYLVKQPAAAYGPDTIAGLRDTLVHSGYNLRQLIRDIAAVAATDGPRPAMTAANLSQTSPP